MNRKAIVAFVLYVATIVVANWLITHAGTVQVPGGAWLLPVGFGLMAPSGAYIAGLTFAARDFAQRTGGRAVGVAAILVGAGISYVLSSPAVALASGITFLISESLDFAVYTPLQRRRFVVAVLASGAVAAFADSVIFLHLAGIPTSALAGLLLARAYAVASGGALARALRARLPGDVRLARAI